MNSQPIDHPHPVVDFTQRLSARLDSLADVSLLSLPEEDQRAVLVGLAKCRAQLESLQLKMLVQAEQSEATVQSGARSAADWLATETRQVRRETRSELRLAEKLEGHLVLSAAMGAGAVNADQVRAIMACLEQLPRAGDFAISTEQRVAAEVHMVALAAHHDAHELRRPGEHLFAVIAPELAEQLEGKALEREEAEALRRTTFTIREDDEGTTHGRFRIPALYGQMLEKMILALTSPSRAVGINSTGIDPDLPTPVGPESAPRTPEATSPPPRPDDSRARPGSSRWCWAPRARSSTWAANAACTPKRCGSRCRCVTEAAPPSTARPHPASVTPTTTNPGQPAATPTSTPGDSSAPTTTAASTTPATRPPDCPTGGSASTGGSEGAPSQRHLDRVNLRGLL